MRRFPFITVTLIALAAYFYYRDPAGCMKMLQRIPAFFQSVANGGEPSPGTSATDSGDLPPALAQAVVLIKGDVAEGTGFLVHTPDGPAVVTNLHVVAANPHLHLLTAAGTEVKVLSFKGASDRDLAMFMVEDDHYSYLDLAANVQDIVATGDAVITPGNSEGGEVILNTRGKVLGIGPERIEISNPVYHGNSGGPIVELEGDKVVGVVTGATKTNPLDPVDKASFANPDSAISGPMRYFGLRVDTVSQWEPYDMTAFLEETTFLKNFHETSLGFDSILNGMRNEKAHLTDNGLPDSKYFMHIEKLRSLGIDYDKLDRSTGSADRVALERQLVLQLQQDAEADIPVIQSMPFYTFDRKTAGQEIAYRQALVAEFAAVGDKIGPQATVDHLRSQGL
jgi:hypothetical protein